MIPSSEGGQDAGSSVESGGGGEGSHSAQSTALGWLARGTTAFAQRNTPRAGPLPCIGGQAPRGGAREFGADATDRASVFRDHPGLHSAGAFVTVPRKRASVIKLSGASIRGITPGLPRAEQRCCARRRSPGDARCDHRGTRISVWGRTKGSGPEPARTLFAQNGTRRIRVKWPLQGSPRRPRAL